MDVTSNATELFDNRPIHNAITVGDYEAVRILISQIHMRINDRNKDGKTSFSLAAEQGNIEILQLLLT